MSSAALAIQHISRTFGATQVLRGVSLSVCGGEFVTLLGPSGCGKTTLLRIIAGLETADSGDITLGDMSLLALPPNKRPVNTVFQNYALFPHLSVRENVAFGLKARRLDAALIRRRVEDGLAMLQIETLAERRPDQLSGGQMQRVALARALVNEPEVLLLDEPMSALDAKLRAEVQLELRRLQRRSGKTFILVTHDQDEAMTVSDRIFVMRAGAIEQTGTPAEVYEHPHSRFVAEFLGAANLIAGEAQDDHVATRLGALRTLAAPVWREGTLAIRPERIRVHGADRPADAPNPVHGLIRDLVYRGDHVDLFVTPNGASLPGAAGLRVRTQNQGDLRVGANVWLALPPEHLEVLHD